MLVHTRETVHATHSVHLLMAMRFRCRGLAQNIKGGKLKNIKGCMDEVGSKKQIPQLKVLS